MAGLFRALRWLCPWLSVLLLCLVPWLSVVLATAGLAATWERSGSVLWRLLVSLFYVLVLGMGAVLTAVMPPTWLTYGRL